MFRSINLGKFYGIDLYVHPTFWILPLFVLLRGVTSGMTMAGISFDICFVFAVFACVILHEIGHALQARVYGIGTRHITLYPVGGVAMLERMPEKPWREIAIALAGPAVNLGIALALFLGLLAGGFLFNPDINSIAANPVIEFVVAVMFANVFLLVFNLLPAFPMDGGRVLRAILATRMPRLQATAAAVRVGTVVAIALGVAGLYFQRVDLVAVAVVVYLLGQAELAMTRMREAGREFRERAEELFRPRDDYEDDYEPHPSAPPAPGFSGLAWDASRRVWVEWKNGVAVGSLPSGR